MDQSPAVNIAETPPERLHAEQHIPGDAEDCPERAWPGGPDCQLAAGHPGQHFARGFAPGIEHDAEPRRLSTILEDILAELRRANTGVVSSVEVRTSARGTDIACKAYAGSDIRPAGDAAVDEYMRVREMLEGLTARAVSA